MFIPDPDFYPSRIPCPGSNSSNKKGGEGGGICCPTFLFFAPTNITKLKIILVFSQKRKFFEPIH
jgi:hypothetical protein